MHNRIGDTASAFLPTKSCCAIIPMPPVRLSRRGIGSQLAILCTMFILCVVGVLAYSYYFHRAGSISITWIPHGRSSTRSASLIASSACFDAT